GGRNDLGGGVGAAGQVQQPAVDQVAGDGGTRQGRPHGAEGGVEAVEAEQHLGPPPGQGDGAEGGLGEQGQGALGADQQAGQVEVLGPQDVVEQVAAAVEGGLRPGALDEGGVLLQEGDDRGDDVVEPAAGGVGGGPAGQPAHVRGLAAVQHG